MACISIRDRGTRPLIGNGNISYDFVVVHIHDVGRREGFDRREKGLI